MEQKDTITKKKFDRIKIIYNRDVEIIDFLSDLEDRSIIYNLQDLIRDAKELPGCLLHLSRADNIVVLILYKSPFQLNDPGNNLMLYADNNLMGLIRYFKNLLEHTSDKKSIINGALNDIVRLLYNEWIKIEDKDTQSNFRG